MENIDWDAELFLRLKITGIVIFAIEFIINLSTGYYDKGKVILDKLEIYNNYKKGRMIFDLYDLYDLFDFWVCLIFDLYDFWVCLIFDFERFLGLFDI